MKSEFIYSKFTKIGTVKGSGCISIRDRYLDKYKGREVYVRVELIIKDKIKAKRNI